MLRSSLSLALPPPVDQVHGSRPDGAVGDRHLFAFIPEAKVCGVRVLTNRHGVSTDPYELRSYGVRIHMTGGVGRMACLIDVRVETVCGYMGSAHTGWFG